MSKKNKESIKATQKIQALIIADSFDEFYRPISLDAPRVCIYELKLTNILQSIFERYCAVFQARTIKESNLIRFDFPWTCKLLLFYLPAKYIMRINIGIFFWSRRER